MRGVSLSLALVVVVVLVVTFGGATAHAHESASSVSSAPVAKSTATATTPVHTLSYVDDVLELLEGIASYYVPRESHWLGCAKDAYDVYTSVQSVVSSASQINRNDLRGDISRVKDMLHGLAHMASAVDHALSDCDLMIVLEKMGALAAKVSSFWGDLAEGAEVAYHIVDIVDNTISLAQDIEHHNWRGAGWAIGGLINDLD
jgi:hypothetical protein